MGAAKRTSEEIDIDVDVDVEPPVTAAPRPRPTLGRYELCHEIASGGMATVYLAVARGASGFGKALALKQIHPHLARERSFVEMFLDEARIASRIQHPNVASVLDFGEAGGTYFLTMEHLVGEPLGRVAAALAERGAPGGSASDRSLAAQIGARIIAEACEGLHAAHELADENGRPLNVVHRDVSPHNLFVGYDGTVKVVDFGVAKAEGRIHSSNTGMLKGKWAYMSPEQLRGHEVDRRADVWSLGVVLYEIVTGRPLFRRSLESETVLSVMRDPIPPLSAVAPGVPPALDAIVSRALARRREDRWPTARDLGRALSRWLASRSCAIDRADVAELMRSLFPDRLEAQRRLLADALADPPTKPTRALPVQSVRPTEWDETAVGGSHSGVVSREGKGRVVTPTVRIVRSAETRSSRARDLLVFLAIAATTAALTVAAWSLVRALGL